MRLPSVTHWIYAPPFPRRLAGSWAPLEVVASRVPLPRPSRADCEACELCHWADFGGGIRARCVHPQGVCTASAARLQPWVRMPFCPRLAAGTFT